MTRFEHFQQRLISLLGLDMDFSVDLATRAMDPVGALLFVGSRPRPEDVPSLRSAGITHVVSCLEENERTTVAFLSEGFQTLFLPARDSVDHPLSTSFLAFFDFVDRAQSAGPDSKLFVHCQAGVSRSSTLAIAWLMRRDKSGFYDTYQAVRSRRSGVLPNIGFASQLQRLENELCDASEAGPCSLARYLCERCNAPVSVDVMQEMLERHDFDAVEALRAVFNGEIPRVVQGVRF